MALAADVAAWVSDPPADATAALGPSAHALEAKTGVPLTHWVRLERSRVPRGAIVVALDEPPVPPPFERLDYEPETPLFTSDWLAPAPSGLGARKLWSWPGGTGEFSVIADIEYDFAPLHEDLRANPPLGVVGTPQGQWAYHGNACLGIAAGAADGFGVTGAAPDAVTVVAFPTIDGSYQVARAIVDVAIWLEAGDVLLIEQQGLQDGTYVPVSANPMIADAIAAVTLLGIAVIEPMGNGATDVSSLVTADPGSIRVGARLAESGSALSGSNFGPLADVSGWGNAIVAPTTAEYSPNLFFPDEDERQAYTSVFGGTSGASAQVAGVVAQLQSIAEAIHDAPLPVEVVRAGLAETGVPQRDDFVPASEQWVGPAPDAQAFARTFLVP
jgi:serine protease